EICGCSAEIPPSPPLSKRGSTAGGLRVGYFSQYGARSSRFNTLPMVLRGSSSRNSIPLRRWLLPRRLLAQSSSSASVSAASRRTTSPRGVSPHWALGMPITAASATPGCSSSTFSRSRSEEHTSELQSRENLVCRLLLEKKKKQQLGCESVHADNSCSPVFSLFSGLIRRPPVPPLFPYTTLFRSQSSSSASVSAASRRTTSPRGVSPHWALGMPITAASATPGCSSSTFSRS